MTFAWNYLRLKHKAGFGIEFNPLDALKLVTEKNYVPKVAIADAWREARQGLDLPEVKTPESHKFDWTFTTSYKGTLFGNDGVELKVGRNSWKYRSAICCHRSHLSEKHIS